LDYLDRTLHITAKDLKLISVPGLTTHKARVWQPANATAPAAAKHMLFCKPGLQIGLYSLTLNLIDLIYIIHI
jgi:hypothetical protein